MKTANKRQTGAGFTLIELLVVISIIALLISILLPAINSARVLAKQTVCSTQMRSMGLAAHMYADNHKGALPPSLIEGNGVVWPAYLAFDGFMVDKQGNQVPQPYQLALFYTTGLVDGGHIFYCPGQARHAWDRDRENALTYVDEKWGKMYDPSDLQYMIRTDYTYWPHEQDVNLYEKRLAKLGDRPFVFDQIYAWEYIAHKSAGGEPRGHNILYGDGHVKWTGTGNEIYVELLWNYDSSYFTGGVYRKGFIEIIRRMEGQTPEPYSVWSP